MHRKDTKRCEFASPHTVQITQVVCVSRLLRVLCGEDQLEHMVTAAAEQPKPVRFGIDSRTSWKT